MRRLRRLQEEEPPGTVPRLNFRQRRLIRALLADPSQEWSFNAIWYTFLLMHRDRVLRRAGKRQQLPPGESHDESHDDERPLWM